MEMMKKKEVNERLNLKTKPLNILIFALTIVIVFVLGYLFVGFIGSLLIFISGVIFLYIAFSDESLDVEIAFN